ncbi:MAG: AAA family ATPase [Anaerolineae bacterium]
MSGTSYPHTIFILGTARDVGKTVTSVGVIGKLLSSEHGYGLNDIGYIKPVGQQVLSVIDDDGSPIDADKDAVVVTSLLKVRNVGYRHLSPVIWQGGLTASFITDSMDGNALEGRHAFMERIRESYDLVARDRKVVIVEGTGQPGVGSVAGISNGDVINMLREMGVPVFVAMVTRGGIGATIDEVFPYFMSLDHLGTRVDGLIINGVFKSKIDKIKESLEGYYNHIFTPLYSPYLHQPFPPILGFVPSIPELGLPTMRLIAQQFGSDPRSSLEIISPEAFEQYGSALVQRMKVVNLRYGYERYVEAGDAVVVGINANDSVLSVVLHHERLLSQNGKGLSGLILSCRQVGGLSQQVRSELNRVEDLPAIAVDYDTADLLQRIDNMSVKLQPYDVYKRDLIAEAYRETVTFWPGL